MVSIFSEEKMDSKFCLVLDAALYFEPYTSHRKSAHHVNRITGGMLDSWVPRLLDHALQVFVSL